MTENADGSAPNLSPVQLAYAKLNSKALPPQHAGQKPSYDIGTVTRATVASEIRQAIRAQKKPSVYRFAEQPVQIVEAEVEAFLDEAKKVRAKTARPVMLNPHSVTGHIEAVADWFKINAEGAQIPKPLPDWVRNLLIATGVEEFPTLKAVLRHPVIMDGKLVHGDKGYDRDSQFLIKANMQENIRPEVLSDTPAQLLQWLLEEWLGETSFDTTEDAIRALMVPATMLVSKTHLMAEGKFPGFLISAPDAGTGKSELAHALVEVVSGEDIGDTPWPEKDGSEMQKLITSLIMADVDVIVWDNLPNGMTIKNSNFDQLLTSVVWTARILGQSQIVAAPSNAVNILTGNNVGLMADTSTRVVRVRLVLKNGLPPTYNRISLRQWTKENRASIVTAIARIMTEVEPAKVPQVGRYPGWFNRVALPFISLTGKTQIFDKWKEAAPQWDEGPLAEFLHAVRKVSMDIHHGDGSNPVTIGQMLMKAPDETAALFGIDDEAIAPITFRFSHKPTQEEQEANNKASAKAVGRVGAMVANRIRKYEDRSAEGLRLRLAQVKNKHGGTSLEIRAEMIE